MTASPGQPPNTRAPGDVATLTSPADAAGAASPLAVAHDLFDGPGETRALARAFDWGASSLGPVEAWSPTLRTVVQLCLGSPFPVNLWCGPERVLIYNDAYRRALGAKHPQAFGRPGLEVWAEIRDALEPMFEQIDAGGPPVYAEDAPFRMVRADDTTEPAAAWFTFGLSAIRDDAGAIVAYFNPATETTARLSAEAELEATKRRLDAALLAGEVGTYQWDVPTDRLWGDANFGRIFGIALDETGAAPLSAYLDAIHPEDREHTMALVQRTLDTGGPYQAVYRIVAGMDEGRPPRWVEARGRLEYDAEGRPLRFPGVVQDITRRREAELERTRLLELAESARREAEIANRAKSDFLAVMSHELRTPLNAIGGYTELMGLGVPVPAPPEFQEYLGRIQAAQRHLLHLINSVLNFAKLEAGRVEFHPKRVAVDELLAMVRPFVEPQVLARRQRFRSVACDPRLHVTADPEKVQQILLNLVSNAIKFTPPGGTIDISAESVDDRTVAIHVSDTGPGIPAEKLAAIFDPFVQVDTQLTREVQGTGLGLAISRELARAMHGDLVVASSTGAGATFTLTLPQA